MPNARYVNIDRDKGIQLVFEFLCSATGGPQEYTGRDTLTTHKGMNISEQEFMAVLDDLFFQSFWDFARIKEAAAIFSIEGAIAVYESVFHITGKTFCIGRGPANP